MKRTKNTEKERFFLLAKRLAESADPKERQRLKRKLAKLTFGN